MVTRKLVLAHIPDIFVPLRNDILELAKDLENDPHPRSDRAERAAKIRQTLEEDLSERIRTEPEHAAPQLCAAFQDVWAERDNITLTDAQLAKVRAEIDAANALVWAYSDVLAYFGFDERRSFLDALFGFDVENERLNDRSAHLLLKSKENRADRWPLVAYISGSGFLIALADSFSGIGGQATSVLVIAGALGMLYAWNMRTEQRNAWVAMHRLEWKWNGKLLAQSYWSEF